MTISLLAFPYFALILIFYRQSDGFMKCYDNLYEYWKTLPVLILSILNYALGSSFSSWQRAYTSLGLLFGAIGDYMIVRPNDGIVVAAACFSIGHIFYLMTFAYRIGAVYIPLLLVTTVIGLVVFCETIAPFLISYPITLTIMAVYSILLSMCLVISGSIYIRGGPYDRPRQFNSLLRFLGFLLFYLSDSALIIHHAGYAVPVAEKFILSTYFMAQYLILCGTSYSYTSQKKTKNWRNVISVNFLNKKCS